MEDVVSAEAEETAEAEEMAEAVDLTTTNNIGTTVRCHHRLRVMVLFQHLRHRLVGINILTLTTVIRAAVIREAVTLQIAD